MKREPDEALRAVLNAQADEVAGLLGLTPEEVMTSGDNLCLTVKQAEELIRLARAGRRRTTS